MTDASFLVLTAGLMKIQVCLDVAPCLFVNGYLRFKRLVFFEMSVTL